MAVTKGINSSKRRNLYRRLRERDGLVCGICGGSLVEEWGKYEQWVAWAELREGTKPKAPFKRGKLELTIDHRVPKSLMRHEPPEIRNGFINLQLAHKTCNVKKGNDYAPH